MAEKTEGAAAPVKIKKYANRRLYNTATSSYVTLDHLCQMVKDGVDFAVYDAKSGEDITRSVLTQIIVEEEAKGQHLLPVAFLRQLIGFYGDNMQQMLLPRYLEVTMEAFAANQEKMRNYVEETFGSVFPFGQIEEMSKQNIAMFERAVKFFNPFPKQGEGAAAGGGEAGGEPDSASGPEEDNAAKIAELQRELEVMQRRLKSMEASASSRAVGGKSS